MLLLLAVSKNVTGKSQFKKPHFSPFMLYVSFKKWEATKMSCVNLHVEIFLKSRFVCVITNYNKTWILRFYFKFKRMQVSNTVKSRAVACLGLVAYFWIFRLFMKGKFDAYVLWPLARRVKNWIVDRSTNRNFKVHRSILLLLHDHDSGIP